MVHAEGLAPPVKWLCVGQLPWLLGEACIKTNHPIARLTCHIWGINRDNVQYIGH